MGRSAQFIGLLAFALVGCATVEGEPTVLQLAPYQATIVDPVTRQSRQQTFVDVTLDTGGRVRLYRSATLQMMQAGVEIRIEGYCISACTMYLLGGCVTPEATLGFHRPHSESKPLTRQQFDAWSSMMAEHYPPAIAQWWMATGRFSLSPALMTGAEAIVLGARECPTVRN